ncbi:Ktr system potassium uptake protein KtrA [Oscillibacter valericigenes Sjm18-20]|nr:Ktr system potassium uptake protein KtrA [Oscillibacter valericigenes Sjm18-20]
MKSILIIGLGRFGKHMAMKLTELHHEVLAVDRNENRVNEVLPYVTNAQIGDSTNEQFIRSLGVRNFDVCVVAIGDDFQSSLETTALLKDSGAPLVVARATRNVHAKFLLRNGADEVVYPEKETAIRAAVKYSSEHIFDYVELAKGFSIYETDVPPEWIGKTVVQLAVRQKSHVSILAVRKNGVLSPLPGPDHVFMADESIFMLGAEKDVMKLLRR